jgi:predicted aspartyl protease
LYREGRNLSLTANINGMPIIMLLDTGAEAICLNLQTVGAPLSTAVGCRHRT